MSIIRVVLQDARRAPLPDRADVEVIRAQFGDVIAIKRNVRGSQPLAFQVEPSEVYLIRAFSSRHRPVGQFVMAQATGRTDIALACPIHPDRVTSVKFPAYTTLPETLREVLERSRLEDSDASGAALYAHLDTFQKAGLLNLHAKMTAVTLGHSSAWTSVESLYRIRGDRLFADVQTSFRDAVKSALSAGLFRAVSGALHSPPPDYCAAGSFKTAEAFGNLQLTFFASLTAPLRFRVDADIDDGEGLEHLFQVLRNWIADGATHPYDIHQILTYYQHLATGYDLIV